MYNKVFLYLLVILSLCCFSSAGQYYNQQEDFLKANGVWSLSNLAGWDFNRQYPGPIQTQMTTSFGHASVADPVTGELLFYSNGGQCWNRDNQVMPNGDSLLGHEYPYNCTQGVCIVPVVGQSKKYYLFSLQSTNSIVYPGPFGTLYYSIVDMSLDNGKGDIVRANKNVLVTRDTLGQGMIAIPGNRCDEIWLVLNRRDRLRFRSYRIHRGGLDTIPVLSAPGGGPAWANEDYSFIGYGGLAVSPARDKIVATCPSVYSLSFATLNPGGTVLCQFDPLTGIVGDAIEVPGAGVSVCGAFSPDNSMLYLLSFTHRQLLQYNVSSLTSTALEASRTVVLEDRNLLSELAYLRQYKGKIYVSRECDANVNTKLGVINNPNLPGPACDFQPAALDLGVPCWNIYYRIKCLPNEVVFPLKRDTAYRVAMDTVICTFNNDFSSLTLPVPSDKNVYYWDNGSIDRRRTIFGPGTYWLAYQQDDCNWQVDSFKVHRVDLTFSLGNDTTAVLCDRPGAQVKLEVNLPDAVYRWQDGSGSHRYQVIRPGKYWVEVNKQGCKASDTIIVKGIFPELKDSTLCKDKPIDITLEAPLVPAGTLIQWSTGSSDQSSIHITEPGLYWIKIISPPCSLSDSMRVDLEICDCHVSIPDAFSPNGDGINDRFRLLSEKGCLVHSYSLVIYNRFGEVVFSSSSIGDGWDGTYKGSPAETGTYFYVARFNGGTNLRGTEYNRKGSMILVR